MNGRNTGHTTRMLINLFAHMFRDKESTVYFVVTPHGINDAEYLKRKVMDLFNVLGIRVLVNGLKLTYEFRWDGEPLFIRTIQFTSEFLWENNKDLWTRGVCSQIFWNN